MAENGFRAFHRAKMSPQDMQVNPISCIFLPKIKLNSLRHYTCGAELYTREYLRTHMYAHVMDGQTDKLQCKINIPIFSKEVSKHKTLLLSCRRVGRLKCDCLQLRINALRQ